MKGRGSPRKGRRIPNNKKVRELALWNTYRKHPKKRLKK
jgi:hypothetical protein